MPENSRRRNIIIIIVLVILLLVVLLLLRCSRHEPAATGRVTGPAPAAPAEPAKPQPPAVASPETKEPDEVLTPAMVKVPEQVNAGAVFSVTWTGPNNRGDYLTIVRPEAPARAYGDYRETKAGNTLEFTAPIEPGAYEVRYVTARSHTVLGRAPFAVMPVGATLDAAAEITLDTPLSVAWTGPNNPGDYITIVAKDTPDGQYGDYTSTNSGSPLKITTPPVAGDAELRYMTGQGGKVLARRLVRLVMPEVSLSAPTETIAGAAVSVTWTGPANAGDYITVVTRNAPDGQYGNYTNVTKGAATDVTMLMDTGDFELRYMTGRSGKVLARRPIRLVAAEVSLSAPATAAAGSAVSITWTGPAYSSDYLTIVPKETADREYGNYTNANAGSPLTVVAPKTTGEHEIRYMTGQDGKVLARRPIRITP